MVFLAQIGLERDSDFQDVPLLTELAKNDEPRQIFKMYSIPVAIVRPFLTTPNVPQDRAKGRLVDLQDLDDLGEISQRSGQPIDFVEPDDI